MFNRKYKYWAIGWAVVILLLSVGKTPQVKNVPITQIDKIAHVIMYAIFTFLLLLSGSLYQKALLKRYTYVVLTAVFYGILMELLQKKFFPSRSFEILDIVANITGVLAASILYYFFTHKKTNTP